METVAQWVVQYGYAGLFVLLVLGIVGLPVPDETLLTFAGYLVFSGRVEILPTFVVAFFGSACGISLSYVLGRTLGLYAVRRYGRYVHVSEQRLERAHRWFLRHGRWTLTFCYYVPGIRHLMAYVAGAAKLEPRIFALFAYSGSLIWCATFISLGYFFGEERARLEARLGQIESVALVAVVVLFGAYLVWRWIAKRRASSPPAT